jgi:DNA-binding MarR family transcriptional regulator
VDEPEVRWLDSDEMRAWRAFIQATFLVPDQLDRELQQAFGVSLAEYEVLAFLSEAADGRLRMSELASSVLFTKSRLTHIVDRLAEAGLVRREPCPDDRRGSYAVLTEAGREWLRRAAPTHLDGVRRHLIDLLDAAQIEVLAEALGRTVDQLRAARRD